MRVRVLVVVVMLAGGKERGGGVFPSRGLNVWPVN